MKSAKECKNRFEDIVAFVMGELDPPAARELQDHIALCDRCREAWAVLMEEEKEVRSGFEALARSLGPIEELVLEEQHQSSVRIGVSNNHFLERTKNMILAHKRLSVAAAATVTALATSLILYVSLFSFSVPVYAVEQTVEANSPKISDQARPEKIGSMMIGTAPSMAAQAVSRIGRRRTTRLSIIASNKECPRLSDRWMKSTRMIESRVTMPARAIMPIMPVAVK